MSSELHCRSIAKAVTWRFTGSVFTFLFSWFIIGQITIAVAITLVEFFGKIVIYWMHERFWLKIKWGKHTASKL